MTIASFSVSLCSTVRALHVLMQGELLRSGDLEEYETAVAASEIGAFAIMSARLFETPRDDMEHLWVISGFRHENTRIFNFKML